MVSMTGKQKRQSEEKKKCGERDSAKLHFVLQSCNEWENVLSPVIYALAQIKDMLPHPPPLPSTVTLSMVLPVTATFQQYEAAYTG